MAEMARTLYNVVLAGIFCDSGCWQLLDAECFSKTLQETDIIVAEMFGLAGW